MIPQLERIQQVVKTFRLATYRIPRFEADDVIATLVREARARDYDVRIITADKDLMQLVSDHVTLFRSYARQEVGRRRGGREVRRASAPRRGRARG